MRVFDPQQGTPEKIRSRIGLICLNDKPRTGASIAWMAGVVAERIIAGMPMFRLTADQRESIVAYILSLKQGGSPPGK